MPASRGVSLLSSDPTQSRLSVQTLFEREKVGRLEAVSDGRWRLVEGPRGALLFDLQADPEQDRNLARSRPEVVGALQKRLERFWREAPGAVVENGVEVDLSADALRALDSLGYTSKEEQQ